MGTHNWLIAAAEPVRLASSSCYKIAIMPRSLLLSLACISCLSRVLARRSPVLGWSTWNSFGCGINSTLIEESIQAMSNSPLHAAGYDHIMIDDCWAACPKIDPSSGHCLEVAPRGADGRIIPDPQKFPNGFRPLTDLARSLGLHLGIYTSVGSLTCAGYMGWIILFMTGACRKPSSGCEMVFGPLHKYWGRPSHITLTLEIQHHHRDSSIPEILE